MQRAGCISICNVLAVYRYATCWLSNKGCLIMCMCLSICLSVYLSVYVYACVFTPLQWPYATDFADIMPSTKVQNEFIITNQQGASVTNKLGASGSGAHTGISDARCVSKSSTKFGARGTRVWCMRYWGLVHDCHARWGLSSCPVCSLVCARREKVFDDDVFVHLPRRPAH